MGDDRNGINKAWAGRIGRCLGERTLGSWAQTGTEPDEEGALQSWSHFYRGSGNSPKRRLSTLLMISD